MITPLDLVAISDFVVAGLCLYLAGVLYGRRHTLPATTMLMSYFLLFIGLAAFMGGLDHGFFEPIDQRYFAKVGTMLSTAAATFCLFKFTLDNYFTGGAHRSLMIIAYIQLVVFIALSFINHHFLIVVGNYAPVLVLFLVMVTINLNKSRSERYYLGFCMLSFIATIIQVSGVQLSALVNSDTLYHLALLVCIIVMYMGSVANEAGSIAVSANPTAQ